jgi:uncharacterized protein HemX
MSGAITATQVLAAVAAVGAGYSIYSGERAASAQQDAQNQAMANAEKQANAADQAQNRANQKHPDTSAILSAAGQAGKAGESGTMLTGPAGVNTSTLNLGKNTLLGQ